MNNEVKNNLSEYEIRVSKSKEVKKLENLLWKDFVEEKLLKIKDLKLVKEDSFENIFKTTGRLVGKREHGKTIFFTIEEEFNIIQGYLKLTEENKDLFERFKNFYDIGDYILVEGSLFKTRMGELTIRVKEIKMLSKCLNPIPDKHVGLNDVETKYRQRYLEMIVYPEVREKFIKRSLMTRFIRDYLDNNNFLEVETPMLHPIPGGAAAKPFITKHNALDRNLYLRIAPELYLKRLLVGGFEKVYEINRNFRNEGLSVRHNPEFTMLEFYMINKDYNYAMDFLEDLMKEVVLKVNGSYSVKYKNIEIDFSKKFLRISAKDLLIKMNIFKEEELKEENIDNCFKNNSLKVPKGFSYNKKVFELFENFAEKKIEEPTFIIDFPIEISPLAKRSNCDPEIASRFELFIAGMEISNGFSELNDPFDQADRFKDQLKEKEDGNDEAMHYDNDYIKALEYGMPPAAGVGVGIDRFAMIITDAKSIKDIILFPAMKKIED